MNDLAPVIQSLLAERERLAARLKQLDGAISLLRSLCAHHLPAGGLDRSMFAADGEDSHHRYFKCTGCGQAETDL